MKTIRRSGPMIVTALLVFGCSDPSSNPVAPVDLTRHPRAASVDHSTAEKLLRAFEAFVPCANGGAGEWVAGTWAGTFIRHTTVGEGGQGFVFWELSNFTGAGAGLTTGNRYRLAVHGMLGRAGAFRTPVLPPWIHPLQGAFRATVRIVGTDEPVVAILTLTRHNVVTGNGTLIITTELSRDAVCIG